MRRGIAGRNLAAGQLGALLFAFDQTQAGDATCPTPVPFNSVYSASSRSVAKIDPLSPAILALSQSKARERNVSAIAPPCKEVADMGAKITISNSHSSHGLNSS
jgi:hypothetical protein